MTTKTNNMEQQNFTIHFDREQLLFFASVIILAGIASNYSTVSPSSSHGIVARSVAEDLLNSILTPSV